MKCSFSQSYRWYCYLLKNSPFMGPISMSSLLQILKVIIGFHFSVSISGGSLSYFIQVIMLISLEYTLAQTWMVFVRVSLPNKGPMRGKYVFLIAKSQSLFYTVSIFNECFWRFWLSLLEMIMLICFGGDCSLTQTRRVVGRVTFHSKGPMRVQYEVPYFYTHFLFQ